MATSEPPAKKPCGTAPIAVSFVGGGQMCEALLEGLLAKGATQAGLVVVSEPVEARRKYLEEKFKVRTTDSNPDAITAPGAEGVVILSVKPQVAAAALSGIKFGESTPLFISIMAGITLAKLEGMGMKRVARTMPNTPALVGLGSCAFVLGTGANESDAATVESVMGAVGIALRVAEEKLLDAVTGLSGSGPGYVYMLIEAMSDGGVKKGLPRDVALKLATQTVMGAAKMVQQTEKHPAVLKNAVESPGGTTIAGTAALEAGCFRSTVINAVCASADRSAELGKI